MRLTKGSSTNNLCHAFIMDYPTKEIFKNYECSVQRLTQICYSNPEVEDKILIENILFINKSFSSLLPLIFKNWFTFCYDVHNYQTVPSTTIKCLNHHIELILTEKTVIGQFPLLWHCFSLRNSGAKYVGKEIPRQIQNFSVCLGNTSTKKNCQRLSRSDCVSCQQWLVHNSAFCQEL